MEEELEEEIFEQKYLPDYKDGDEARILYTTDEFKKWLISAENLSNTVDDIIEIPGNDNTYFFNIERNLNLEQYYTKNVSTGKIYCTKENYIKIIIDYLGYDNIKNDEQKQEIVNLIPSNLISKQYVGSVLSKNKKEKRQEFFDINIEIDKNIIVTNIQQYEDMNVTYEYSILNSPTLMDFSLNAELILIHSEGIYKVYENTEKLYNILEKLRNEVSDGNIKIYFYLDGKFFNGIYYTNNNKLEINRGDINIENLIPEGFHNRYNNRFTLEFEIYDYKIDMEIFAYAIMTTELKNNLRIMEFHNPYMLQNNYHIEIKQIDTDNWIKLDLDFKKINLNEEQLLQKYDFGFTRYWIKNEENITFRTKKEYYKIICKLNHAITEYHAYSTLWLFVYLLGIYKNKYVDEIEKKFKKNIPGFEPIYISGIRKLDEKESILLRLRAAAPDIFIDGYAKQFQVPGKQPEIKTDAEIEELSKQYYEDEWRVLHMKFPNKPVNGQKQINLICEDTINKYPGVKLNPLPNRDKYAYIPGCYATPQINKSKHWNNYISGKKPVESEDIATNIRHQLQVVNNQLNMGRYGILPTDLSKLFETYKIGENLIRVGVYKGSNNNFIHCIMYAISSVLKDITLISPSNDRWIDVENYISSDDKETFIMTWRNNLTSGKYYVESCLQENVDYTLDKIKDIIMNNDMEFKSENFYRIIERYFNVNIIIFLLYEKSEKAILEIPNHKIFHVREYNYNIPTIILFKHVSKNKDDISHYELIGMHRNVINKEKNIGIKTIMDNTSNILNLYSDLYTIYNITTASIYKNIYNFSIESIFKNKNISMTGQLLDTYNKMRGIEIYIESLGIYGTIIFIPQSPMNLPIKTSIVPFPYDVAIKLFQGNVITAKNIYKENIQGLWFSLFDYDLGIYVPIFFNSKSEAMINHKNKLIKDIRITNISNPLIPTEDKNDDYMKWKYMNDMFSILLTTISIIFYKYPNDINEFENIFVHDTFSKNYYLKALNVDKMISFESYNDLISYIEEESKNTLIKNGKIILKSDKLYNDILYYFRRFLLPSYSPNLYNKIQQTNIGIIESDNLDELELIIRSNMLDYMVISKPTDLTYLNREPYIYMGWTTFIVQNVKYGDKYRALNVAKVWKNERINMGYDSDRNIYNILYAEYVISNNNILLNSEKDFPIRLLKFNENTYAALLDLS